MLRIRYAVTFEFDTRPPLTLRGTVAASTVGTCARRAIEVAQTELRPHNWSSLVFVALERAEVPSPDEPLEDVPTEVD